MKFIPVQRSLIAAARRRNIKKSQIVEVFGISIANFKKNQGYNIQKGKVFKHKVTIIKNPISKNYLYK